MTIPLDRLYHYIENILKEIHGVTVIYRFWPHGSKKLEDLQPLRQLDWITRLVAPPVICHDQEPLDFDYYENYPVFDTAWAKLLNHYGCYQTNLKQTNIFDGTLLLHSEKRSAQVETYQQAGYVPAYYWSHALISRDWFRYAEHVTQKKLVTKTFLIYNRAWSGTREYRLKFAELLLGLGLEKACHMSINPIEPELGIHYNLHEFSKHIWKPKQVLENYFPASSAHSHYSADFDIQDYQSTDIEIVLETLFDDDRLHLTEKSLRPIACGQPFVLAGTHGSLEYLQSYGFKTFADIWDESYDLIQDPQERLWRIANLMQDIANWSPGQRKYNLAQAQKIADYNKQHFFSQRFFDAIAQELHRNLTQAVRKLLETNTSQAFINRRKKQCQHADLREVLIGRVPHPSGEPLVPCEPGKEATLMPQGIVQVLKHARSYYNNHIQSVKNP